MSNGISLSKLAQRVRLLAALRQHGEISTDDARTLYAAMSPASRIMELRRQGYQIDTVYRLVEDAQGIFHRMGVYLYRGEVAHG